MCAWASAGRQDDGSRCNTEVGKSVARSSCGEKKSLVHGLPNLSGIFAMAPPSCVKSMHF